MTWTPNAAALSAASTTTARYTSVPLIRRQQSVNSRGAFVWSPGLKALRDHIASEYGITTFWGRGRSTLLPKRDPHLYGRALDAMCGIEKGHEIANFLLAIADSAGVILVINDGIQWGAGINHSQPKVYRGSSPHTDHVHLELSRQGCMGELPWYSGKVSQSDIDTYLSAISGDPAANGDTSHQDPSRVSPFPKEAAVVGGIVLAGSALAAYRYG